METNVSFDCRYQYPSGFELDVAFETDAPVTALFGPSGSGKTTVLSLIAGILKPKDGRICIGDRVLVDSSENVYTSADQRRVGLLFQDYCLFPHLSVKANIEYGWRRQSGSKVPLERVIETMELEPMLERFPNSLSGGEKQRVALARALACGPELLLLDEPLTAVESELRERIVQFISRVVEEFSTPILLVSHNRRFVERLGCRIIDIENCHTEN